MPIVAISSGSDDRAGHSAGLTARQEFFASFAPSWLKNPVYREGAKDAKKKNLLLDLSAVTLIAVSFCDGVELKAQDGDAVSLPMPIQGCTIMHGIFH